MTLVAAAVLQVGIAVYVTPDAGVTPAEVEAACVGFDAQLREDVCPAWARLPVGVRFYADAKAIPKGTPAIQIARVCDDAEALAYHTESASGAISGLVGVETCKADGVDWRSAASHEIVETTIDPFCNMFALTGDESGEAISDEPCDAVEDGSYQKHGVAVSNFVLPAWLDIEGEAPFDFMGKLSAPMTKTAGGYYETLLKGRIVQEGEKKHARHTRLPRGKSKIARIPNVPVPVPVDDQQFEIERVARRFELARLNNRPPSAADIERLRALVRS